MSHVINSSCKYHFIPVLIKCNTGHLFMFIAAGWVIHNYPHCQTTPPLRGAATTNCSVFICELHAISFNLVLCNLFCTKSNASRCTTLHFRFQLCFLFISKDNSRLKVQKLRDQSESSSVFLRGLYALGTHLVRSVYGVTGTELVRSGYGAARSIFFRSPYTPQNTF